MSTEIQEYSKTEAALTELRKKYADKKYDVAETKGLKLAKEARAEVKKYRIDLENKRVEIKAPALEQCRLIDSEAARIKVELVALESPIDAQIKEEEMRKEKEREAKIQAELNRVEDIQERLAELRGAVSAVNSMGLPEPEKVEQFIDDVEKIVVDDSFDEFEVQASEAKASTLELLREVLAAANEREAEEKRIAAERAELAELREAQEKREQEAAAEREAEEKKQREKFVTQQKKQKEAQDIIDAENKQLADARAQLEADQAEDKRKKDTEAEAERKRRERAQEAAKRAKYPGAQAIINALVEHFGVSREVATEWIKKLRSAS